MGKAVRWFRSILGLKKHDHPPQPPYSSCSSPQRPPPLRHQHSIRKPRDRKRTWMFAKSYREKNHTTLPAKDVGRDDGGDRSERHAIAMAAATAAVAEAAIVAARAAAEVVRLASGSRRCINAARLYADGDTEWLQNVAALKIQSVFRGYLARRALRALKALVRLQALARGHLERKRTSKWFQRIHALVQAQERARVARVTKSESSTSVSHASHFQNHGPPTPEKFEPTRTRNKKYDHTSMLKRIGSRSDERWISEKEKARVNRSERRRDDGALDRILSQTKSRDYEEDKIDKILEIDTMKPNLAPRRRSLFQSSSVSDQSSHGFPSLKHVKPRTVAGSSSSGEVQSLSALLSPFDGEDPSCTAENSPCFLSASSRGGSGNRNPFVPAKMGECKGVLGGYPYCPNYMCYTESSKAKVRSVSVPRQRLGYL